MCQAYEAERSMIVAGEDRAIRKGYQAALDGKPRDLPTEYEHTLYDKAAWFHGYDCVKAGIKPFAVELAEKASGRLVYVSIETTQMWIDIINERDQANARAEASKALLLDYRRSHPRCTDDRTANDHFDNRCAFCRTIDQTISEQEAKAKEREG